MKHFLKMSILGTLLLLALGLAATSASGITALPDAGEQISYGIVEFPPNRMYAVYSGPGKHYFRGNNGMAMVSTNGWIDVIGADGDWILIEYGLNVGGRRRGYITKSALPPDVKIPEIIKEHLSAVTNTTCRLTDDPATTQRGLAILAEDTKLLLLHRYGNWWYVEVTFPTNAYRGYLPVSVISR